MTSDGSAGASVATPGLEEPELRQLLGRIAASDQAAMATFYRHAESRVHRFALSRLNDSFAAADILNETMIEVWRHAGRFQGRSKVMTWVLGIANHKVIDLIRKANREPIAEPDESLPDTDSPTPEASAGLASERERIRNCLATLSEKHRTALHLAFFEDMAYGEIAEIVGCPEGTVKTRVFHAKEALKKCLAQPTA